MALDRRKVFGWGGLLLASVLAFAVWVLLTLFAARPGLRMILDVTPGQSVSVRPGTEKLIRDLQKKDDERIEIYTIFERLPQGSTPQQRATLAIFRRVQDLAVGLLRQYDALGGDRLIVKHVETRREPEISRKILERLDVRQPHVIVVAVVRTKEDGTETLRKRVIPVQDLAVIDGPKANVPGSEKRMPVLEAFTGEEQLSSAIKTLVAGSTPVVYLIKGHGEELASQSKSPYDYTNLIGALQDDGFKVQALNLNEEEIPPAATILGCFEPKTEFTAEEAKQVHRFLRRGGRMFLNLGYHDVATRNPKLEELLGPLGVQVGSQMVMQLWDNAPAQKAELLEIYPKNTALPITRPLVAARRTIGLRRARPIFPTKDPVADASLDRSLLRTERRCWLARRKSGHETSYVPGDATESFSVGAVVTVQSETRHAGRLVIVGGIGFNNANFDRGSQKDFALNSFAWLAERTESISLRERADRRKSNVIKRSSNQDVVASVLSRSRLTLVFLVPGLFLALGLLVWWRRRRI